MRRLLILLAVFLMIVFNGIAFNVLGDSHGHSDGDNHDEVEVKDKSEDMDMKDTGGDDMKQHQGGVTEKNH